MSVSTGSIKKYMTQDGGKESPGKQSGAKSKVPEGPQKNGQRRQLRDTDTIDTSMFINKEIKEDAAVGPRQKKQLLTKGEMAEMFTRLELFIKGEMATLHDDLNQILKRAKRTDGRITERTEVHDVQN